MKNREYLKFIKEKTIVNKVKGFDIDICDINSALFNYQRDIVKWACKKGRAAVFADTGLGKTIMQLEWARLVSEFDNCSVIIMAPLCIAEQTIEEGKNVLGLHVAKYTKDMSNDELKKGVYITNYEQMHNVNFEKFNGVILDESSILKHTDSKTRLMLIEYTKKIDFRLSLTATPAPNDYMEFGSQSEFLGIMTQASMWATYFIHDSGNTSKWRLKGHSQSDFWGWVSSWAVIFRKPSDIGYPECDFNLPDIDYINHVVETDLLESDYIIKKKIGLSGRIKARRDTIDLRVKRAIDIVNNIKSRNEFEPIIIWCQLNDESKMISELISDSVEVKGSDKESIKKSRLVGFSNGDHKILVTKPKIAGFGMNWQHCRNMIFVGLNDSYEQVYQAIRRSYRFGQSENVNVHIITSDIENSVLENIKEKETKMIDMYKNILSHMNKFQSRDSISKVNLKKANYSEKETRGDNFTAYLGDCVQQCKNIDDNSVDYSIFSPPFASLYTYSDSDMDMGNSVSYDQFSRHISFLIKELYRVVDNGRVVSIHCSNIPTSKARDGVIGIRDFRGDLIRLMTLNGFIFSSEVAIWKCPVNSMQRTKALGLLWRQIQKNSAMNRQGLCDYVISFRKPGETKRPVAHTKEQFPVSRWQKLASPTWQNIKQSNTLNFKAAREKKDERHICPLQLDVIERCLDLWSMPGDTVFSPFMGVGSEGYVSLEMGRKFIGIELKSSYYENSIENLREADNNIRKLWPGDKPLYDKEPFDIIDDNVDGVDKLECSGASEYAQNKNQTTIFDMGDIIY